MEIGVDGLLALLVVETEVEHRIGTSGKEELAWIFFLIIPRLRSNFLQSCATPGGGGFGVNTDEEEDNVVDLAATTGGCGVKRDDEDTLLDLVEAIEALACEGEAMTGE